MNMDIYEIHKWIDLCEDSDKDIREKALAIVDKWDKDIQPKQMWRMKGDDEDAVCTIISIDKRIRVEVDTYSDDYGARKKIVYFGRNSFFSKWERMF